MKSPYLPTKKMYRPIQGRHPSVKSRFNILVPILFYLESPPIWNYSYDKLRHTFIFEKHNIDVDAHKHFFFWKFPIYSSIMAVQRTIEVIKITTRSTDHLATSTKIGASRRRAAPPSPEPDKPCCTRQTRSHHAKAPKDQLTRAATVADK
jgi:hypothetical protein